MLDPPPGERATVSIRSRFTRDFGPDEARALVNAARRCEAPMSMAQIRVLGGANARVPTDATAFGHRKHRFMVSFLAMYGGGPETVAAQERWVSESVASVAPISEGTYVNFLGDGRGEGHRDRLFGGDAWAPAPGEAPLRPGQFAPAQHQHHPGLHRALYARATTRWHRRTKPGIRTARLFRGCAV